MNDAVRFLCQNSTVPISVLPNAGLPHNEGGHAVYKLTPAELAAYHRRFVSEYGVQVVGGLVVGPMEPATKRGFSGVEY